YQPPRENPWLEAIEVQDSAYPFHDWNERITAECYEPNASSRILTGDGRIERIVNNYANVSFNFGATLLSWLEVHAPDTYRRILLADQESRELFSGHGSALAQVYNHMIMPLANRRDKITQVRWGIRDFEARFGRPPEGMWLAETGVDNETLDVLAEHGIKFTILAPNQAHEVRKYRGRNWHDVSGSRIDPTTAYEVRLPSKRKIALFFYDGPISRAIAFEGLLTRGEHLAGRLMGAFTDHREWPQLVHIATDGESYGHHHRHGDMALAYALHHIQQHNLAKITNYGEYLEKHPPLDEVRIYDNSSWSCAHGIERWRSDCGCNSGGRPGWNQSWRGPLRAALDWLRDELAGPFEEMASRMFKDPWEARNGYIDVILDRSRESVERFFSQYGSHKSSPSVMSNGLMLMEMQRQALLMYTSCGWFFDELSGIETTQIMAYAGRAVQLAEYLFGKKLEDEFRKRLSEAKSNLPELGDGRQIYDRFVKPSMVDLKDVGAHFAVSSLFEDYKQRNRVFAYRADVEEFQVFETGRARLVVGNATISSQITWHSAKLGFGVFHWSDHNIYGGIKKFASSEEFQRFVKQLTEPFRQAEFTRVVSLLDKEFASDTFSLRSLFRDEQRKILDRILDAGPAESAYRELYENSAPLMHFLASLGVPRPKAFATAAEYVLNIDLRRSFESDVNPTRVQALLDEARICGVELDRAGLGYALAQRVQQAAESLRQHPLELSRLETLDTLVSVALSMPFEVNLRPAQNVHYDLLRCHYADQKTRVEAGEAKCDAWLQCMRGLADKLSVLVDS
ncbi:MAG: DUF3536 domain-containing protein, partial [Planctomycetales bacterium]|nr:DUF3536 domain-containing protein [Planctomycetales bacterium]